MRGYNSNPGSVLMSGFEYASAPDILKDKGGVLQKKYQNLTMPSRLSIQPVSAIPLMTFRVKSGFEKNYRAVMSLFFDEATLARQKIQYDEDETWSNSYSFMSDTDKISAAVFGSGSVLIRKADAYDLKFNNEACERVSLIHVDRGENENISYPLLDKKYTVADAVSYVNKWLAEKWAKFEPGFTFQVKTVIVRKLDPTHDFYQITAEKLYKGIPLDELIDVQSKHDSTGTYFTCIQNYISLQMLTSGTISSFSNYYGYDIAGEDTSSKKCITLKSATDTVEQKLSGFKNIRISDIHLKYTLCPVYDHTVIYTNKEKTKGYTKQSVHSSGFTVTSRPVYAFIIDADPKEYQKPDGKIYEDDPRKYVYVDALTGEIRLRMDFVRHAS